MLRSGIPLTRCLHALSKQAANPTLGKAIYEIALNVESGISFSESLAAYQEIFNKLYIDMIRAGELGDAMEEVLLRLAQQLDSEKELRDSIKSAMFYPVVVLAFATVVMLAMFFFIVPVFVGMFPPGTELPLLTRMIVALSDSLRTYWYLYFAGAIIFVVGLRAYLGGKTGRDQWDRLRFRLPIFGELVRKATIARFARTLSTLLGGGIPILQALETAGPASGSNQVTEAVRVAGLRIQEGQGIAEPLRQSRLFPAMVTLMIGVGEETGDLPGLLSRVAEFFEQEVRTMTKGLTSIIEPLMMIVVGGMVGVMVISLYLPIFTVITQIR